MTTLAKVSFILALIGLFSLTVSHAQNIPPLQVSPAQPQAGQLIEAIVLIGSEPDGFCFEPVPNVEGQIFNVSLDGNFTNPRHYKKVCSMRAISTTFTENISTH